MAEENKQRVVTSLKKRQESPEEWHKEDVRRAAVLVPMVVVDGAPSILFTVRSQLVSRHRNEVR